MALILNEEQRLLQDNCTDSIAVVNYRCGNRNDGFAGILVAKPRFHFPTL